ncbi:MAG: GNAT family N-acetyltransferase [Bacteroidetes bacterium GWE2_39_28]|nr:MAG: GNAT family N-acetyltransferase [Bacteroidetes bacterium GWE2_39_28]OFY15590.1 MAG: GNAT family N-acetyltransferase [Bacteroidetes bacterium GWF2_39_10]OFZ11872.1 MAG: GNAT family N-acetyltransferase [Bacteroidetes bacterium RIFOXYC2_FULL_39_11]HCT94145.1 GNAT family N-acetyltransferase [Rikenellaceae bacterium]
MGFVIREANSSDINLIFDFICDLADYEKLRHDVTATPEILHESIFVKKQAEVLIAELDDLPVGFALYFHNFSTFKGKACLYLEDIFIKPQYRGKGFGKAIFNRLAQIAVERGCDRFDWAVLDWNEPSINFYKSLGAFPMDEWTVFRLTGDALKSVAHKEK